MNILARILSHGFAIALVLLLAIGFMYRGELFPDMPLPAFLGIDKETAKETETAAAPDTGTVDAEPESPAATTESAARDAGKTTVAPETAATEPVVDTGIEPPPVVETPPEMDVAAEAATPAPVPVPESREIVTEEATPDPDMPGTDQAPAATVAGDEEAIEEPRRAIEEESAVDESDTVPDAGLPSTVIPAPAPDDSAVLDTPADAGVAEDTRAIEEPAPATEPDMAEMSPVEQAATETPATGTARILPADEADAGAETPDEAPAIERADEAVISAPATGIPRQSAVAGDTESYDIAASGTESDPAPASTSATETTLDMSRPYHVLAAAREAYWLRNLEEAEALYRQLIALEPENPDGYGELGNLFFTQGRWEDAATAYFDAGSRLARSGNIMEAENMLEVIRGLSSSQADELAGIIAASR